MRPMKYDEFFEEILERNEKVAEWNHVTDNWKEETLKIQGELVIEESKEFDNAVGVVDVVKELVDCLVVQGYFFNLTMFFKPLKIHHFKDHYNATLKQAFTMQRMGFNILLAFDKVIESNYNKFDNYREDMLDKYDEHCKYLEKDGRYSNVKWERAGEYVVYRSGEGKLLKGRNYQEPDLSWLQEAA